MKPSAPLVKVYDLDDTLARCKEYYQQANQEFYNICTVAIPGLTQAQARERLSQTEMASISSGRAFRQEGYPTNMRDAYRSLAREHGVKISTSVEEQCWENGMSVYNAPYEVYPGVREMLQRYLDQGVIMGLCTKGEESIQRRKIEINNLEPFFSHIKVVPNKTPRAIRGVADTLRRGRGGEAYMIGDSKRDDIAGGIAAGLHTVWVTEIADVAWSYDDEYTHIEPTHIIRKATEMPNIVPFSSPVLTQSAAAPLAARRRSR